MYYDPEGWCAVPANNGGNGPTWQWDSEILTGFTMGKYMETYQQHQVDDGKPYVSWLARSLDGGTDFEFVSWIVPWGDRNRAVMPAPVRYSDLNLVVTLRRKSKTNNWIDCWTSDNNGESWDFLSTVGDTEDGSLYSGNPPSMIKLVDGRLCCVYGNRTDREIICRTSADRGETWSVARVLRDDFHSVNDWPDLGYCRLFQRPDGQCVVIYFWCTVEMPRTRIAVTIFDPGEPVGLYARWRQATIPVVKDRSKDWFAQAQNDLLWARDTFRARHFAQACFVCQQTAEKAIKSLAISRGFDQVRSHLILEIVQELGIDGELKNIAQRLDQYYISTRYPDAFPSGAPYQFFTEEQAGEALSFVEKFLHIIASLLEHDDGR